MNIQVFNEIDSTQLEAKRQIDACGFIADKIIVAVNQTNGITTKKDATLIGHVFPYSLLDRLLFSASDFNILP